MIRPFRTIDAAECLGSLAQSRAGIDLARFNYGYNGLGSIAQIAQTRNFTCDALPRMTSGGTTRAPESYPYDAEGNRSASHRSAAHSHDAANWFLEYDGFCYAYDANGYLTSKPAKVLNT